MKVKWRDSRGGVALEYLMVSVFGFVLALGVMATSTRFLKGKLESELEKMGVELPEEDLFFYDLTRSE